MIAPLHTALLLLAGGFLAGTGLHGQRVIRGDRRIEHLFLSIICLIATVYLAIEANQLVCFDRVRYLHWFQISRYATGLFMFVYPVFVAYATGSRGRIEVAIFGGSAAIFMIHNTVVPSGPWLTSIDSIQTYVLPWGERCAIPQGPRSDWAFVAIYMWAGVGVYCLTRDLISRGIGIFGPRVFFWSHIFLLATVFHDYLVMEGILHSLPWAYFIAPVLTGGIWWQISLLERRRTEAFRDLFVGSGDAILVHDAASGEVVEANDAACTLFRAARSELVGATLNDIISPESAKKGTDSVRRTSELKKGVSVLRERTLRRKDGSDFHAEVALRMATLEGRERFIASFRDLTDWIRVESTLVENELRLRTVIARSPIAIIEATMEGVLTSINPRFTELFGYRDKDALSLERFATVERELPKKDLGQIDQWRTIFSDSIVDNGVIPSLRCTIDDLWGRRHRVDLCGAVTGERAVLFVTDLSDILDAKDEMARREAFYRVLVQVSTDGICVFTFNTDLRPVVALWNTRMAEITGLTREQAVTDNWLELIDHEPSRERLQVLLQRSNGETLHDQEWELQRNNGTSRSCSISTVELPHSRGKRRILLTVRDVTAFLRAERERRQADAQVQHAQKLESLGMLAGGIAHDFNNILTAILGRAGLMASRLGSGHAARGHLRDMEQASRRAAALCQQLLAYAGKGRTRVGPIDLRSMVEEMSHVLSVSVSDNVTFLSDGLSDLPYIRGDANQVRQVVMNLITNAAESIESRIGTVTLRMGHRQVENPLPIEGDALLSPGPYVVLEVIDTGSGMDETTRQRMFEPFFTTKPRGRGLGMAAVLGIVHGHGGGLQVESVLGSGTTMRALFPIFEGPHTEFTPVQLLPVLQPTGTVMVVDDEDSIRRTTRDMLIHLGFETLEASSGAEAIAMYQASPTRICAVVLDLTMPGLDGYQTFRLLRERDPGVQVILASGYSRDEVARTLGGADIAAFLQKPFDIETLNNALHLVLDGSSRGKLPIT